MSNLIYIFSIQPQYSDQIATGTKTIEVRRRSLKLHHGSQILIYTTTPNQHVNLAATIKTTTINTPEKIWVDHKQHLGINKNKYDEYMHGTDQATAIHLKDIQPLNPEPLPFRPPQSYYVLDPEDELKIDKWRWAQSLIHRNKQNA